MPRRAIQALVAASFILICGDRHEPARADEGMSTLKQMFAGLKRCWRPPVLPDGDAGMQITVQVTFTRAGEIFGQPRITFETPAASDTDRLLYRTAVMQTLQHCTPLPFTGGLGDAVAGRPFTLRFDDRRNQPKTKERQAWLSPKIP